MELVSSPKKLPILAVLFEAGWYVWKLRKEVALAISFPVAASLGITVLLYFAKLDGPIYQATISVLLTVPYCLAAISCHRLVLLGTGSVPLCGVTGSHAREWKFIAAALGFTGATWGIAFLVASIGVNGTGGGAFALIAVVGVFLSLPLYAMLLVFLTSLSLVFPAIATDRTLGIQEAFQLARGNRMRLAVLLLGIPVLVGFAFQFIFDGRYGLIWLLISRLLYWCIVPFEVAILSLCYKKLVMRAE